MRKIAFTLLPLLLICWVTTAHAKFDPTASINRLKAAADRGGAQCYMRDLGNGKKRLYLNTGSYGALNAVCNAVGANTNVVQICHINKSGHMHTLGAFDGRAPHFQTPDGFQTWRLNDWGGAYHSNTNQMYSAFIQLTPTEGKNLRNLFAKAKISQAQNAKRTIPDRWARGNCASLWTNLPIGEKGETLGQITGIGQNGSPHGLQQALESRGNERVFAIGVFGPKIQNFGANKNANVFTFRQ